MNLLKALVFAAPIAVLASSVAAADFEAHMLNKGADGVMVFDSFDENPAWRHGNLCPHGQRLQRGNSQGDVLNAGRLCNQVHAPLSNGNVCRGCCKRRPVKSRRCENGKLSHKVRERVDKALSQL